MVRAPFYDKDGVKKGAWSLEEDDKLRAYILKYGHPNWRELPKLAGLPRCGKSCRLRWMNYLRPDIKLGNYTQEDDNLITQLHEEIGNKWSVIASRLPGRSDNEIKNHWHTHLKKRTKMKPKQSHQLLSKEHSSESSQCESFTNNRESEAESTTADPNIDHDQVLSHQIIDTSQSSSPEETTSNMNKECFSLLSSNSNNAYVPTITAINCFPAQDVFIGDFWTEPFVQDDTYNEYHPTYFVEGGGLILPNAYFFYDDGAMDL